ncbi:hypothetical protein ACUY3P_07465 [Corynebacterium lehmanniae]
MFYRASGPAPLDPALLAREIERRAGLSSCGPQVRTLPQLRDDALVAGDGYWLAGRSAVDKLRVFDRNVVAYAVGEAFIVTSLQEIGATMLRGRDLVRVPHGIFRVPEWGQRTFVAGETAEFLRGYLELEAAGRFVEPARYRRRDRERVAMTVNANAPSTAVDSSVPPR